MSNSEEAVFYPDGISYKEGETCRLKIADGLVCSFKVLKPFKVHGSSKDKLVVTVPLTLDTLKGLGFISKLKGGKK